MATTALGGALVRDEAGTWRWRDGEVARVRDMRLGDLAPAFRCTSAPEPAILDRAKTLGWTP